MTRTPTDRLLGPGSPGDRALRRWGRVIVPKLSPDMRRRLRLPLMRSGEVYRIVKACRHALQETGLDDPDWNTVLALADTHAPPFLARQLRDIAFDAPPHRHELKLVTAFMALQGHNATAQTRYHALLQAHDPVLRLPDGLTEGAFMGRGVGAGSLNSYRRVRIDGAWLFEKIYFTGHWELERMRYAQAHLIPRLRAIHSPRLLHLVQGDTLAAAYFEWADLPDRRKRTAGSATALFNSLAAIDPGGLPAPPADMLDFSVGILDWMLEAAPTELAARFPDHDLDLAAALPRWGVQIAAGPRGFAHGDPSSGNVLPDRWVLDWDNCGLFPLGHDAAHYLALRHRGMPWNRLRDFFEEKFLDPRDPEASWRGFLYFFLHFQMKLPRRHDTQVPGALAELTRLMEPG